MTFSLLFDISSLKVLPKSFVIVPSGNEDCTLKHNTFKRNQMARYHTLSLGIAFQCFMTTLDFGGDDDDGGSGGPAGGQYWVYLGN